MGIQKALSASLREWWTFWPFSFNRHDACIILSKKKSPDSHRLDSSTPPVETSTSFIYQTRVSSNSYHQSFELENLQKPMTLNFKLAKEALNSDGKEKDRTELWIFLNRGLMPMLKYASECLPRTNRVVTRRYPDLGSGDLLGTELSWNKSKQR